ncbi:PepSY domain-containing protein [Delftia sp. UME58]|uniref:PepSY domain-containing protein n=1 Tax=Delftia sp. UME58 TaxID=1862322 RepID=UPI0016012532|nr:PepSY domain-containing protein [Delftia sp. UME58]MBB1648737.1 peptidase [Delftia sp. UME58]
MKPAPFARTAALSIALALTCATAALPAAAKSVAEWQTITSQAKIPLEQAITRATQAVPGKAIEAQLDDGDGMGPRYEVEVITPAGDSVEVWVNAITGQAAQHKNDGAAKRKDRQRLEKAKSTIEQAIQAATKHTPGTPVSAELDSHWGQTSYQVEVLQANGTLMEVKIDAAGGEVIRAKKD